MLTGVTGETAKCTAFARKAGHTAIIARVTGTAVPTMRNADNEKKGERTMTGALCMFALWAWGGWISWKGIENGNGWIGVILSEKIRKSLNKKENWWKKALLSVAFGYVAMGAKVIEWILTFVMRMVDGSLFR